jgi:hypothetical protein
MANQAYFPASEADRVVWLTHFRAKLPVHGPTLGISPDEIAATLADIDYYVWLLHTWNPAVQQNALEATAYKANIATGTATELVPLPVPAKRVTLSLTRRTRRQIP